MERLFDNLGAYRFTSFTGKHGIYKLVGTTINDKQTKIKYESEIPKSILRVIDTFKKPDGDYKDFQRWEVMEQADLGNIKPIESSEVKLNTETKRKNGRAI